MSKKMKLAILGSVGGVVGLFLIYALMSMMSGLPTLIEYETTNNDGLIEVRLYPEILVAQITLEGNRAPTRAQGVQALKAYFEGKNSFYENIPMYAPILQQESRHKENSWMISMVMPQKYKTETIPKPDDDRIKFVNIPAQSYATISFGGGDDDKNLDAHYEKMRVRLQQNKVIPASKALYAFYSPGWALGMLRTVEVMTFVEPDLKLRQDLE